MDNSTTDPVAAPLVPPGEPYRWALPDNTTGMANLAAVFEYGQAISENSVGAKGLILVVFRGINTWSMLMDGCWVEDIAESTWTSLGPGVCAASVCMQFVVCSCVKE